MLGAFMFFVGLAIGIYCGLDCAHAHWRHEAIKHGFAEYNATNGNWQWKSGGGK